MAYRVYRARGGVSRARMFVGKLGKNLAATWSECHKHVRMTECKLTLQVRCVEADVKEGDAPSKLTARNLAKASRRSLRKLPDEMKTALACMALVPVLSPAKHYATALGGSGTPSLGTQVPWHDVFGCSEYLFYDMVILPLAKEFLDEIGAQLASAVSVYRQSQGGDDSESDEDDGTEDPPGFNTRRTIRELIKTKGKLPPGGGDKHHKAFLARFKVIMLDLVQEARGELPAANECSLEVAEDFFPYNYTNGVLGGDDAGGDAGGDADAYAGAGAGGDDEESSDEGSVQNDQENADTESEYEEGTGAGDTETED